MEKATYLGEHLPEELPEYLQGIDWPVTKDDAIVYAAEHGAPEEVLQYLEDLPAAVFTTEEGVRHAFGALQNVDLSQLMTLDEEEPEAEDGISS